ncbi:ABC transporter permease [Acrocarpospora sp. B8E8]|uniref:ABC transporter permease n=1 Tax=Acrocarpospora sp. B8E8 TaxID=3153572 RepID=UPI00325C9E43
MRAIVVITVKELRQRMRDTSLLMFALVLPFGLAAVFNLMIGGIDTAQAFRYAVADADRGTHSAAFVEDVLGPAERAGVIEVEAVADATTARERVERGEATAAFLIPAGFSAAVQRGGAARLEVLGDVDAPIATQVARSLAEQYATTLDGVRLSVATALATGTTRAPGELARDASADKAAIEVDDVTATRRELTGQTYLAAGMAVFFLFFTVQFGGLGLLAERDTGTLPRLLAAPVPKITLLAGKLLAVFLVGVVSMAVLIAASSLLLNARWGDVSGLALLIPAGVLAAIGIMSIVAALARTAEQASNWHAVIAVTLGALGGTFFPVAQVGGPIETISLITPHRWFLAGLADLSGGGGAAAVWPSAAVLCAFALVTGSIAVIGFRREALR